VLAVAVWHHAALDHRRPVLRWITRKFGDGFSTPWPLHQRHVGYFISQNRVRIDWRSISRLKEIARILPGF